MDIFINKIFFRSVRPLKKLVTRRVYYDFFTDRSKRTNQDFEAMNFTEANSLQLTFHSSEFAYFRGTLERRFILDETVENDKDKVDQRFLVQAVAILGSHPAHYY